MRFIVNFFYGLSIVTVYSLGGDVVSIKAVILEGPRATGKSTVARRLREEIWGSTWINPTGFSDDGQEGLQKIAKYYKGFFDMFASFQKSKEVLGDVTFIFDRFFFSEMVYSQLYKEYDFEAHYNIFVRKMFESFDEIEIYYLRHSEEHELVSRLNRDKVDLFDAIPENVQEIMKQQAKYDEVLFAFEKEHAGQPKLSTFHIDTSDKTIDEVVEIIRPF